MGNAILKDDQQQRPEETAQLETDPAVSQNDDPSDLERIEKEKKHKEKHLAEKRKTSLIFVTIGYVAVILSLATFIPIVVEVYTVPGAAAHVNIWTIWLAALANTLWLVYSVGVKAWPLLASSAATLILVALIIIQVYLAPVQLTDEAQAVPQITDTTPVPV